MHKYLPVLVSVLLGTSFFFISCDSEKKNGPIYFDLKEYFSNEIAHLDSIKPGVQKMVQSNGKEETKNTKDINWKNEFQAFVDCDLNKPALKGSFVVDTILGEEDYSVVYSAKDSTQQIQFAMINFDSAKRVTKINIKLLERNKLYNSLQTYSYVPRQSYSIEMVQDVFLSGKKTNSMFALFEK